MACMIINSLFPERMPFSDEARFLYVCWLTHLHIAERPWEACLQTSVCMQNACQAKVPGKCQVREVARLKRYPLYTATLISEFQD